MKRGDELAPIRPCCVPRQKNLFPFCHSRSPRPNLADRASVDRIGNLIAIDSLQATWNRAVRLILNERSVVAYHQALLARQPLIHSQSVIIQASPSRSSIWASSPASVVMIHAAVKIDPQILVLAVTH